MLEAFSPDNKEAENKKWENKEEKSSFVSSFDKLRTYAKKLDAIASVKQRWYEEGSIHCVPPPTMSDIKTWVVEVKMKFVSLKEKLFWVNRTISIQKKNASWDVIEDYMLLLDAEWKFTYKDCIKEKEYIKNSTSTIDSKDLFCFEPDADFLKQKVEEINAFIELSIIRKESLTLKKEIEEKK